MPQLTPLPNASEVTKFTERTAISSDVHVYDPEDEYDHLDAFAEKKDAIYRCLGQQLVDLGLVDVRHIIMHQDENLPDKHFRIMVYWKEDLAG